MQPRILFCGCTEYAKSSKRSCRCSSDCQSNQQKCSTSFLWYVSLMFRYMLRNMLITYSVLFFLVCFPNVSGAICCARTDAVMAWSFLQWLEAASATGIKLFLIVDGLDQMAATATGSSDDPIGFLPKTLPVGIRCVLSTGPGITLSSLAQRGCGAITIRPMDEKQVLLLFSLQLCNLSF